MQKKVLAHTRLRRTGALKHEFLFDEIIKYLMDLLLIGHIWSLFIGDDSMANLPRNMSVFL